MDWESDIDPCEVCKYKEAATLRSAFDGIHQRCPRCGEFKAAGSTAPIVRRLKAIERIKLSGWIREQNRANLTPFISTDNIHNIISRTIPSVATRSNMLLLEASEGLEKLGERFDINDPRFLAATYSSSQEDVNFLMRMLNDQSFAELVALGGEGSILPAGYVQIDSLNRSTVGSVRGFVAMSFSDELFDAYSNGLEAAIFDAGYDPVRVDRLEHVNRIDDEIILQINESKFLVADFTGHRGGVYFEAGYALGIGIPVFWSCRKDEMEKLHFDIRQFNCIDWETPEELQNRLATRVEAVLGRGPK